MTVGQDLGSMDGDRADLTTFHVRRAESGDGTSLEWVVTRFSPLLLAQAEFRLGPRLRRLHAPEDLVNDVWAIALPRLPDLGAREGRRTPVLLRFLATTLLHRVNDLVKVEISGPRGRRQQSGPSSDGGSDLFARIPSDSSGVVTATIRRERESAIARALGELEPSDRELIVLRAIEQNPGSTVAFILKVPEKEVSRRYRRALSRLRERIPGSVFEELAED
jgi:RNA polymerase sigma factor (sigma-70 family)